MATPTEPADAPEFAPTAPLRSALITSGVLSLIVGLLILIWPGKTAQVVTMIVAFYAVIAGLLYFWATVSDKSSSGLARLGHGILGILFVAAGVIAFLNPAPASAWLSVIVVVMIGIAWIVEGVVSLATASLARRSGWTFFFGIVSIFAGAFLLTTPLWAAVLLWFWFGISLVTLGVFQLLRGLSLRRRATA